MSTAAAPPVHRIPRTVQARYAAIAGLTGPLLFTVVVLLQQLSRRDEYDPVAQTISELEAGPRGWIQQADFLVFAALLLVFVVGLHRAVAPTRYGALGPGLLGLSCVGLVLAAVFPIREDATGAMIQSSGHMASGVLFFSTSVLALVALSPRLARDPQWRGLTRHTLVAGVVGLVGFVVLGLLAVPEEAPLHDYAGILQRTVLWTVTFPCVLALAWRLRSLSRG